MIRHSVPRAMCVLGLLAALSSCASRPALVSPQPSPSSQILGPAEAQACGSMLIATSDTNFLPIKLNGRYHRAYRRAVASVPGATALTNVTASEYWFFWVIGRTFCTTIRGDAVK